MFRLSLKSRPDRSDESRHVAAFLKARVVDLLRLSDEDRVTVNEIVCADLGCPEIETIILVMRGGERTRALKIPKEAKLVDEADLLAAFAEAGYP